MTGAPHAGDVPFDASGVADHCGVTIAAVKKWRTRGILPEPDGRLGRSDYWWQSTIEQWWVGRQDRR